jgi:hypothetical protein
MYEDNFYSIVLAYVYEFRYIIKKMFAELLKNFQKIIREQE